MKLTVGQSLSSAVDDTTVVVVRAPDTEVSVACGGVRMFDPKTGSASDEAADPAHAEGTQIGKRYVVDGVTIELLCTKPGTGSLTVDDVLMSVKAAKALPSSD